MVPMFNDFVDGFLPKSKVGKPIHQDHKCTGPLLRKHGKRKPDLCTPFLNWLPSVYRWASSCSSPPLRFSLA